MDRFDRASYMADLTFIMDFHEKLGTSKNPHIVAEFNRHHALLVDELRKENEYETRKSIEYKPREAYPNEVNQGLARSRV